MGYRAWIDESKFHVAPDKLDAMLEALLQSRGKYNTTTEAIEEINDWEFIPTFRKLEELIYLVWGLRITLGEDKGIIKLGFAWEKLTGSEEEFFTTIAPFVTADSYVQWCGEDGSQWRFVFDGTKAETKHPKVSWE